jgi:hypothetical protein
MHTLEWIYFGMMITWNAKLFLHRQLRHLTVTAPSKYRPDQISTRIYALVHLICTRSTCSYEPWGTPGDELRMLVRNLPELRKIVLPEFHFTSSLIEELSRAKNIRVVEIAYDTMRGQW